MRFVVFFCLFCLFAAPVFSQRGPTAVARSGEGAHSLLRRNGLPDTRHFQQFLTLNQGRLTTNNGLVAGRTYRLPARGKAAPAKVAAPAQAPAGSSASVLHEPLFGPRHSRVQVLDRTMRGAVYYLSPGHGGPDPGAVGKYGKQLLAEDEYAYDVTLRLARRLMEHGATVYVLVQDPNDGIRDEQFLEVDRDEVTYPRQRIPLNQLARLRQRIVQANQLHARHKGAYQRLLSLHVDSRSQGQKIDVFFYHHANSQAGLRTARNIHGVFTNRYGRSQPNRPYSGNVGPRSSLYEVRNSHAPAVFMELGNIHNARDQPRFLLPDNRQALANWIYEGLRADFKGR
ncbi:N-acetylmuramoyl-L-alanine amidase family protein [Hymenobacter lapidiphilus]|uniref:N-acetylmuramoyl-L-alanine amidase family protein n=1 Tax=Hymenobacter sp. CCM 8763 TaxID=2303334 RepID=UPI0018F88F26|nr:N-acetylmuramoyl-L-alanine amidase [Hymenobacter sp. CCM 8763]